MLRMSWWVFRRFAQQLFRYQARVLQCGLRLLSIALEQVKRSFQESLRHGARAFGSQCLTRKFLHDGKGFRKLALQGEGPGFRPSYHPIRVNIGWKRRNLLFRSNEIALGCNCEVCFKPDGYERLRRYGRRAIKRL